MDTGMDDGFITPILVPGMCETAVPEKIAVPKLDAFTNTVLSLITL